MRLCVLMLAAMVVSVGSVASGATTQQTFQFNTTTYFDAVGTQQNQIFNIVATFDTFDTSLGALTQIDLAFNYDFDIVVEGLAAEYSGGASAGGALWINGVLDFNGTGGGYGAGGGDGPTTVTVGFSANATQSFVVGNLDINPAWIDAFLDSAGPTVDLVWTADLYATPGADTLVSLILADTSNVVVTYTYTPIPEPASLALLAPMGALLMRRRRR